jgi:hypothetical protein
MSGEKLQAIALRIADAVTGEKSSDVMVVLQIMALSLARANGALDDDDPESVERFFDTFTTTLRLAQQQTRVRPLQ